MTAIESAYNAPTAVMVLGEDGVERFLALILEGKGRHEAARELGVTGSQMRSFCREGGRDPEFARRYAEAVEEARGRYRDELREKARARAAESDRLLEVELATHVEEYRHLRRDRVKHEGHVTSAGLVIHLDPSKLDGMGLDELRELRATLERLGGDVIDQEGEAA